MQTMSDKSFSHRLLGKFFTDSTPPSFEETEQSLREQWTFISGDMTVQKLDDDSDTFLFEFIQEKDKTMVLSGRHYNVNGTILVLKDPNSSEMIDFTKVSLLGKAVGLPTYLLTEEYSPILKSELSYYNNPVIFGKTSKNGTRILFRVEVDLKKPLSPGFYLSKNRFVEFRYFDLGDFCYNCGMIGQIKENCNQVKFPKVRDLNATSRMHVYGPWLRIKPPEASYETVLMKTTKNGVDECEKTLSYPQFFIEIEFNIVYVCKTKTESTLPLVKRIHRFRFPCSYFDTDSTTATCEAYEVLCREIYENTPFSLGEFEDKPDVIASLVEELMFKKKNEFGCDDKWLTFKLQINKKYKVNPIYYETELAHSRDFDCQLLIESKISDLIKKRVEEKENLLSLSSWEKQIREVLSEIELTLPMHLLDVSKRAKEAMEEAVQMEISSSKCPIPADRSTVTRLESFKVLGSDMDRFDPCVICAEEMFLGQDATVLPCSHVFHSSCIKNWLRVGHKCPLCGFKLPTHK